MVDQALEKSGMLGRFYSKSGADERLAPRWQVWRLCRRSGRNGNKKAAVATAHTILRVIYYTLSTHNPYVEYGAAFGAQSAESRAHKLAKELEWLG